MVVLPKKAVVRTCLRLMSGHPSAGAVIHPPERSFSTVVVESEQRRAHETGTRARDAKKEGRAVAAGLGPRRARARACGGRGGGAQRTSRRGSLGDKSH